MCSEIGFIWCSASGRSTGGTRRARAVWDPESSGAAEIRTALAENRWLFAPIGLFSAFVNLLMLTGPLFMLQVYDRVLTSRPEATLVALAGIAAFLFLMMGLLDHFRARVLARAGARFQERLDPRVLGAWMAIRAEVTPGITIAASIFLGRALAPIDQAVGQWPILQRALEARRSLPALLGATPEEPVRTSLPTPRAWMEASNLVVGAPRSNSPAVRGVSFAHEPGEAIGIAGASASGKSTLAKALAGVWPPAAGRVTLGGAALDQYGEDTLARHIGWLPQVQVVRSGPPPGARPDPCVGAGCARRRAAAL